MSLNKGSKIVPLNVANRMLLSQDKLREGVVLPKNYGRVQLLTITALKALVYAGHDRSYITYGELSGDFPLCADFSDLCRTDIKREAIKRGLAVRPMFGEIYFTRTVPKRHAINFGLLMNGRVIYYEPQTGKWSGSPKYLKTLDKFKI